MTDWESDSQSVIIPFIALLERTYMIIKRRISIHLEKGATYYPVLCVLGPRQSGKTTLVKQTFPQHGYISLEDLDVRTQVKADPRRFLRNYATEFGLILDEIQHVPELLSYMQTIVDADKKKGFFVITGSQNLLISQVVSQTLAGRVGILTLLPLSTQELLDAGCLPDMIEEVVFKGSYPKMYADSIPPEILYKDYITTYVERDVRSISNVSNLNTFQRFIQLCAARTGQLLNLTSLGNDCDIDHKTARAWLSILEASYIVFLVHPYHNNYGKRLIKSPKLYFTDTGVACSLLRIKSFNEVMDHYLRGNLIETYIMADLLKQQHNQNERPSLYFWRDQTGREVDALVERAMNTIAIEIKGGQTVSADYFNNLSFVKNIADTAMKNMVIYTGLNNQSWPNAEVISWRHAGEIIL